MMASSLCMLVMHARVSVSRKLRRGMETLACIPARRLEERQRGVKAISGSSRAVQGLTAGDMLDERMHVRNKHRRHLDETKC